MRPVRCGNLNVVMRNGNGFAGLDCDFDTFGFRITSIDSHPGQPSLRVDDLITKIGEHTLRQGRRSEDEMFDIFGANLTDQVAIEYVPQTYRQPTSWTPKQLSTGIAALRLPLDLAHRCREVCYTIFDDLHVLSSRFEVHAALNELTRDVEISGNSEAVEHAAQECRHILGFYFPECIDCIQDSTLIWS